MRVRHVAWTAAAWSLLTIAVATGVARDAEGRFLDWLRVSSDGGSAGLWHAATFVGDLPMMAFMTAAAAWYLARTGRLREAFLLGGATVLAQVVSRTVKALVARPRPEAGLVETSTFSYPSGHALVPAVLLLSWALLAGGGRRGAWVLAAGLAFLIGASRVALGVHYATDVLSGWLLALLVTAGVARLRSTIRPGRDAAPPGA